MMRIIINADDLGLSQKVNEEIANSLSSGLITSSTILANSNYWDDIHRIVGAYPKASFGAHLNLTEGQAMTKSKVLQEIGIVDEQNLFTRKIQSLSRIEKPVQNALYEELSAQLNKVVVDEKIDISHIDGHHHIHTLPILTPVILELIERFGIKRMRNRYSYPLSFPHLGLKDKCWKARFTLRGVEITHYFDSYTGFVKRLNHGLTYNLNSTVELMCHPGHEKYIDEMMLVTAHEVENSVKGVTYISYLDL